MYNVPIFSVFKQNTIQFLFFFLFQNTKIGNDFSEISICFKLPNDSGLKFVSKNIQLLTIYKLFSTQKQKKQNLVWMKVYCLRTSQETRIVSKDLIVPPV